MFGQDDIKKINKKNEYQYETINLENNIELRLFAKNNFTYVLNSYKDLLNKYANVKQSNIEKEIKIETKKIQNECGTYKEIFFNDKFVGVIRFVTQKKNIELDDFYISPEFRKQGIGTIVLKYFMSLAMKYNYQLLIQNHLSNYGAEKLFTKLGFEPVKNIDNKRLFVYNQKSKDKK